MLLEQNTRTLNTLLFKMVFIIPDNHSNKSHYHLVKVSDSSMTECYLKIGEGLDNTTGCVYSEAASMIGGIGALFTAIVGFTLNFLVICALMKTPSLRKEYLTPFLISLALTDILFSAMALPMTSARYFARYVLYMINCEGNLFMYAVIS